MARDEGLQYSKTRVNKAGDFVRQLVTDPNAIFAASEEQVQAAFDVILSFRAAHRYPLTKADMGLRSAVRTVGAPCEVSQRLKRLPTIVDKLCRHPTMALARMQDIGGCRAVLRDVQELRAVENRVKRNAVKRTGEIAGYKDYITQPAQSGYRGVHIIVDYDDRHIEVQLRTQLQHQWAYTVERMGSRLGVDLKSGSGPVEVLSLLSAISEAMAFEEIGQVPAPSLQENIARLRRAARPYLEG